MTTPGKHSLARPQPQAKLKRPLLLVTALLATAGAVLLFSLLALRQHQDPGFHTHLPGPSPALDKTASPGQETSTLERSSASKSLPQRQRMSDKDRLAYIQRLGCVPSDADWKDRDLATQTSWWGSPLDPTQFWKGRPVWLDESARASAAARGREWPPIPYDNPTLTRLFPAIASAYPNNGPTHWGQASPEGPKLSRGGAWTSRERAFWLEFLSHQPSPPERIEWAQIDLAEQSLKDPKLLRDASELGVALSAEELAARHESRRRELIAMNIPPEALGANGPFWAYVLNRREEYKRLLARGGTPESSQLKTFLRLLLVNPDYITGPLSDEQVLAANAWKIAYLQRLRRENTDESYIKAYLQAWHLSAAEVFGQ